MPPSKPVHANQSVQAAPRSASPHRAGSERPPHVASSEPAVIALRMEDLTVWMIERVAKMPRDHKFTVGDKLVEACLETTTLLVEASFIREKAPLLAQASRALTRGRVLVRIAHRLHLLSDSQRVYFADQTLEIGKMLGGWTRSLRSR